MQSFCHFKVNNFILKTKTTPTYNYYRFFSKTVSNKYGLPNLAKLIQGDVYFLHLQKTYTLYILIYFLQINYQIIVFVSFQSLNGFLNNLCGNKFYWRLKIYKDFLETSGNIVTCHIYKMLLQQSNFYWTYF